jgi:hypothetical protein
MYQVKNKIYADAGYVLRYENKVAFSFEGVDINNVLETKINLENIQKSGNFVIYDDLKDKITSSDFAKLKSKFVNKQFTNDDQIAIMLNKDESEEDAFLFNKMQEWRA